MKLSSYVIDFLHQRGVTHVFGMSGGAAVHLLDSVDRQDGIEFVCSQHEQSAAISADGYARATGKLGVAIVTSGPGATNLLTGTCCSYFDSVPTLMLTGQVATHRLRGDRDIRQMGFQETDVVSIFASVTKYAAQVTKAEDIRYILERAYYTAFDGRPGSVVIDIPDDLQRVEVDHDAMRSYTPEPEIRVDGKALKQQLQEILAALKNAKRPVIVLGGGLKTPQFDFDLEEFVSLLGMPALCSWAGVDLLPDDHPLKVGPFGVYGPRTGNYAVQNADFILCLGTRLSQNLTGGILKSFARDAVIAMIDASAGEMSKFDGRGVDVAHRVQARLDVAMPVLKELVEQSPVSKNTDWINKIVEWKKAFAADLPDPTPAKNHIGAYEFIRHFSKQVPEDHLIYVDTGGNLTWTCNGFSFKKGQRLYSSWNNTPMGYALPAAIGASVASPDTPISCIIGDGGLMICLAELATLVKRNMNVRVYLFNNHGHGIQKQTLETWLDGNYVGVNEESGLAFTDFVAVAKAMGLETYTIDNSDTIDKTLVDVAKETGPVLVNVEINPDQRLFPVLKFGAALEDQMPSLDPADIERHMIIPIYKKA